MELVVLYSDGNFCVSSDKMFMTFYFDDVVVKYKSIINGDIDVVE